MRWRVNRPPIRIAGIEYFLAMTPAVLITAELEIATRKILRPL